MAGQVSDIRIVTEKYSWMQIGNKHYYYRTDNGKVVDTITEVVVGAPSQKIYEWRSDTYITLGDAKRAVESTRTAVY